MPYTPIPESSVAVGKAIKTELLRRVRDNLEDHEERLSSLSLGSAPIEVFNFPIINATSASSMTGLTYYRALSTFTLSTVQIEIFEKGTITSGTLSVDVKKGTTFDPASFSSTLTDPPVINFATDPDYTTATGVMDPLNQTVLQGEILRLDITSLPTGTLGRFRVLVYGNI
jgi:hypothetical protein